MGEGFEHEGRVVGEETHHAVQVGEFRKGILGVGLALGPVEIVGQRAENLESIALDHIGGRIEISRVLGTPEDRVDDALTTALGVVLFEASDEQHHGAPLRQGLADEIAAETAGLVVVHADVQQPITGGSVGIVSDQLGAFGRRVEDIRLIGGIDRADGDAIDTAGQEILDDAFLVGDAFDRHEGFGSDPELLASGLHSCGGDGPEGRYAIADKGDLLLASGGGGP